MLRLLHVADLHLDRAFAGQTYSGCDGAQRRAILRGALESAVDLALERDAGALTIGGDLFENEHVTRDTAAFIVRQLGRLSCPVVIASGNHDFSSAISPYRTVAWPAHVTLALEPAATRVEFEDAVIWAAGYPGPQIDPRVLESFAIPRDDPRPQLLLIHAVDLSTLNPDLHWGGLGLRSDAVRSAGFDHALLGHVHQGQVGELMSWPGSSAPLDAAEAGGNHGGLWVEVDAGGVRVESIAISPLSYETVSVDVGEVSDSTELENLVGAEFSDGDLTGALVTCRLWGNRKPGLEVDVEALATSLQGLARGVRVVDATAAHADLRDLAHEPNARGAAIGRLLADGSATALWAATLVAEAFDGEVRVPQ